MYNCTSRVSPYISPNFQVSGVVLPHSEKILSSEDIDRKMEKAKSHIVHLIQSLPHRNTHGGKRFRARQIAIQDKITSTSKRLEFLKGAKEVAVIAHAESLKQKYAVVTDFQFMQSSSVGGVCQKMTVINENDAIETIGSVMILAKAQLAAFDSPVFRNMNTSILPKEITDIIKIIALVKDEFNFPTEEIVMLGDLYMNPEFRGFGYAKRLIQKTCENIFSETDARLIVLTPDPFEYENGIQKRLVGTDDYNVKKEALVKFYSNCGFTSSNGEPHFMYLKK